MTACVRKGNEKVVNFVMMPGIKGEECRRHLSRRVPPGGGRPEASTFERLRSA